MDCSTHVGHTFSSSLRAEHLFAWGDLRARGISELGTGPSPFSVFRKEPRLGEEVCGSPAGSSSTAEFCVLGLPSEFVLSDLDVKNHLILTNRISKVTIRRRKKWRTLYNDTMVTFFFSRWVKMPAIICTWPLGWKYCISTLQTVSLGGQKWWLRIIWIHSDY